MAEIDKWSIDKLDSSNWMTWKFQIKHLLLAKDLLGLVDGMEVLQDDASAQQWVDFNKGSQKAFSTMVMSVSSSQLYLITSYEEPRRAWTALRNHFERDTLVNKLILKKSKSKYSCTVTPKTSIKSNENDRRHFNGGAYQNHERVNRQVSSY